MDKYLPPVAKICRQFFQESLVFTSVPEMERITQPLRQLGIKGFIYESYYPDGSVVSLSNVPNHMEYYYRYRIFEHSGFARHRFPDGPLMGKFVSVHPKFIQLSHHCNLSGSFTIVENGPSYYTGYHFLLTRQQIPAVPLLHGHISILYHFIAYFKSHAHQLIEKAHRERFRYPLIMETGQSSNFNLDHKNIAKFLKSTNYKRLYLGSEFDGEYLTARELDVVCLLTKGKSLMDISSQLKLSEKTVEYHIQNIKEKFQCHTLCELGFKMGRLEKQLCPNPII